MYMAGTYWVQLMAGTLRQAALPLVVAPVHCSTRTCTTHIGGIAQHKGHTIFLSLPAYLLSIQPSPPLGAPPTSIITVIIVIHSPFTKHPPLCARSDRPRHGRQLKQAPLLRRRALKYLPGQNPRSQITDRVSRIRPSRASRGSLGTEARTSWSCVVHDPGPAGNQVPVYVFVCVSILQKTDDLESRLDAAPAPVSRATRRPSICYHRLVSAPHPPRLRRHETFVPRPARMRRPRRHGGSWPAGL